MTDHDVTVSSPSKIEMPDERSIAEQAPARVDIAANAVGSGRSRPAGQASRSAGKSPGANRNDCILLEPTLDAIDERGLLADVDTMHLDRGYDNGIVRALCAEVGLDDRAGAHR